MFIAQLGQTSNIAAVAVAIVGSRPSDNNLAVTIGILNLLIITIIITNDIFYI